MCASSTYTGTTINVRFSGWRGIVYDFMKSSSKYLLADLNITYTCSKVTIVGEGATTSGCYKQKLDGYETEVCACRSRIGEMPCNSSTAMNRNSLLAVTVAFSGILWIKGALLEGQTFT